VHQNREKVQGFDEVEGAMKGKRFGQLSLGSLGHLGSLAREIWERIRFQVLNSSFNICKSEYMSEI